MRTPGIVTLKNVLEDAQSTQAEINGRWVPARPFGYYSWRYRVKAAWLVFTGKCDALQWPEGQ